MKLQIMIQKNIKYIFLFVLFFLYLSLFYSTFAGDQMYNYGFSYAISRGEIPYKDFNMIIPPVGPLLYTIPFLFGKSLILFNLFQSFLLCILFSFIFKLFKIKGWFLLIVLTMVLPISFVTSIFQGYNFLLLLEVVVLLYLEKNQGNDYLIGFILGLAVFTKQTVGVALCLVSFYYLFKDYKKILKRLCGFLIPCFLFLIYFIVTGTLYEFFDMCLFGMFDFTNKNSGILKIILDFNFYVFLIEFFVLIVYVIFNRENILYYYVFAYLLMAVPLFDYNHVAYFSFLFMFIFMEKFEIKNKKFGIYAYLFSFIVSVIWFFFIYDFRIPNFVKYNNIGLYIMGVDSNKEIVEISKFMTKHNNSILLSENSYIVKVNLDWDINHYDLLNYGNHGYNGTKKLINMIEKEKETYFIVNMMAYRKSDLRQQINKEVMGYVIENYEKVGELYNYDIYYKE